MDGRIARAAAAVELKWRQARTDCVNFITNYIYIEDRDAPELAVPFALWPGQVDTINAFLTNRLIILLKARQLGCSWASLAYATWRLVFTPGYSVVALSKREDDAKELNRRVVFMLRYLPRWMIRERKTAGAAFSGPTWEATTLTVTIYHPKGEPSLFNAMSSAPDSGRSFTSSLVILDEWSFQPFAEEIWSAAYPTINRPTGGQVIGLSTNKRGSFFETTWKAAVKGQSGFTPVFLSWQTDPRRTDAWYEQSKLDLPYSYRQEYPRTPEEALDAGEGTAFPEFTYEIHVVKPFEIPAWWKRWRANDPGYADPFAWHWFAVSPDGIVYLYREYTRGEKDPKVTYSDQAREVLRLTGDEKIGNTVCGRDAWNKLGKALDTAGKSIVDCYRDGGLVGCSPPPTDQMRARIIRKAVMHEYLKPFQEERLERTIAKLQIFSSCTALIEALPNLVVDDKDAEKVGLFPHVHLNPYDCCGYGLVAWEAARSKPPVEELTGEAKKIHDHIESMIKRKKKQKRYM